MVKATTGSAAYEKAYQIFIAAGKKYRAVADLYRARKINTDQYLKARSIYLEAHEQMDVAEANEATS
ncbi:hypothetical protein LCGC14_1905510 [marine sediment metagenome]|uniref:Uncharacterized protein n=1 Tax=marine sediment metagenome TaxID=412755 RepID=A0A0F9ITF0_9ZZZZ